MAKALPGKVYKRLIFFAGARAGLALTLICARSLMQVKKAYKNCCKYACIAAWRTCFMPGTNGGNAGPALIVLPSTRLKTNEKEFAALREAMRKYPNAFVQSAMAGMGGNFEGTSDHDEGKLNINIPITPAHPINKPIEMPEK